SDDMIVNADLESNLHVLGFAGAASGFVSLGAAVSFVTDDSSARAMIGASPGSDTHDIATDEGTSELDGAVITGFHNVKVTSNATINHFIIDGVDVASGGVAAGAAVSSTTVDGTAQAIIGDFTQIGTEAAPLAGGVTVNATRTFTLAPFASGDPLGVAVG